MTLMDKRNSSRKHTLFPNKKYYSDLRMIIQQE